jgi:hypothetical protein
MSVRETVNWFQLVLIKSMVYVHCPDINFKGLTEGWQNYMVQFGFWFPD